MKLAIMQPYFFPYLGYFHLLASVDQFVVYDIVQFSKGGWLNRNRILHPTNGWQYVTVPMERASVRDHIEKSVPIKEVQVSKEPHWRQRMLGQLEHYKKTAPFYRDTSALVQDCLAADTEYISELNVKGLNQICRLLGIESHCQLASELQLTFAPDLSAQEKVLLICEHFGADEYINLPGGRTLYDEASFVRRGIKLTFCELPPLEYNCAPYEFVASLSILDLLMWNSPEQIRSHLEEYGN